MYKKNLFLILNLLILQLNTNSFSYSFKENIFKNIICYLSSTKLLLACKSNDLKKVESILSNCDEKIINQPNSKLETPLFWACEKDNFEIAKMLIEHGAIKSINESLQSPILSSYEQGDKKIFVYLLKNGADLNQKIYGMKGSIIHLACLEDDLKMVKFLVQHGYEVDNRAESNETPLMIACCEKNIEIAKYLLSAGASLEKVDNNGMNAFFYAIQTGSIKMIDLMLANGGNINSKKFHDGRTLLIHSILINNNKVTKYLISKGADVNMPDYNNTTPLFFACYMNNFEIVKLLIDNGAKESINKCDNNKNTAIKIAYEFGYEKIVNYLIKNGAI